MELALAMNTHYSTRQMFDVIEVLDTYDAFRAQERALAKAKVKE